MSLFPYTFGRQFAKLTSISVLRTVFTGIRPVSVNLLFTWKIAFPRALTIWHGGEILGRCRTGKADYQYGTVYSSRKSFIAVMRFSSFYIPAAATVLLWCHGSVQSGPSVTVTVIGVERIKENVKVSRIPDVKSVNSPFKQCYGSKSSFVRIPLGSNSERNPNKSYVRNHFTS